MFIVVYKESTTRPYYELVESSPYPDPILHFNSILHLI